MMLRKSILANMVNALGILALGMHWSGSNATVTLSDVPGKTHAREQEMQASVFCECPCNHETSKCVRPDQAAQLLRKAGARDADAAPEIPLFT